MKSRGPCYSCDLSVSSETEKITRNKIRVNLNFKGQNRKKKTPPCLSYFFPNQNSRTFQKVVPAEKPKNENEWMKYIYVLKLVLRRSVKKSKIKNFLAYVKKMVS
jgi:hypothetical protein